MKSRGATIISGIRIFLSGISCLFAILALVAAIPSFVLCLTLRWELPKDTFFEKKCKEIYSKKNTTKMLKPVSSNKDWAL